MELILAWSIIIMRDNYVEQRRDAYIIIVKKVRARLILDFKSRLIKDYKITSDDFYDYMQETFIKIWENKIIDSESMPLPIIRTEDGIFAFFKKILRNHVIDKCIANNRRGSILTMTDDEIHAAYNEEIHNSLIENELDTNEIHATINNPLYANAVQMIRNVKGYGIGERMVGFFRNKPDCALLLSRFYDLNPPPGIYAQLIEMYAEYRNSTIPALTTKKNECLVKLQNHLQIFNS